MSGEESRADVWPAEAFGSAVLEVRSYCGTAVSLLVRPRQFLRSWANGAASPMNPLGFFASSLVVVGSLKQIQRFSPVAGGGSGSSLLTDALAAFGPYLHYVILGMLCFVLLWLPGRRRGAILASGVALYAGGVASVLTSAVLEPILLLLRGRAQPSDAVYQAHVGWITAAVGGGFLVFALVLVLGLSGALGTRRATTAAALLVSWVLTGLVFGWVKPPGEYGFHLMLEIHRKAADPRSVSVSLVF